MRITVLVDNYAARPVSLRGKLLAEWGFSAYLHEPRILFDTGLSGYALINNARALGISLDEPDYLVLSHRHSDHTGGVIKFLDTRSRPIRIVAHENLFARATVVDERGEFEIGVNFTKDDLRRRNADLTLIKDPHALPGDVLVSGEIPRRWGPSHAGGVGDAIPDDMALYVNGPQGLVVITGCGHSGPENTVEYGLQLTGTDRIHAIIGGLHFMGLDEHRMREAADYIASRRPELVVGTHCTGIVGLAILWERMRDSFALGGVGASFEL